MEKRKIIPTLLEPDEAGLVAHLTQLKKWKTALHLDITDGVFARPRSAQAIKLTRLPSGSEVHLMVNSPLTYAPLLLALRPTTVILHVESHSLDSMITSCRKHGFQVRLAIKTSTPTSKLDQFAAQVDGFHVLLGPLGSYGGKFDPRMVARVRQLHGLYPKHLLSADVGITESHLPSLAEAGVSVFCVGSAIHQAKNPKGRWAKMQHQLKKL